VQGEPSQGQRLRQVARQRGQGVVVTQPEAVGARQANWSDAPVSAGYFRTEAGEEADLVLERDDGQVIAFEIKAGTRISSEDLRGIRLLKDRLGSRLEEAVILYTGEHAYQHDGYIWILPLSELWRHWADAAAAPRPAQAP
jgi:uncharacterized protein